MKKSIIISLIAIFALTAYGGQPSKIVKAEPVYVSHSIQVPVSTGSATHDLQLPQARAREVGIQELRRITYGQPVLLTYRRLNWQDRSNRLWVTDHMTMYKPIAKTFSMPALYSPPKIC